MLMDLRPQCPCNRQMFPGIQDKLSLFQGCHLVHIDDAVPVAAYELGIAEQQAGKIVKTHVSPHKPVLQMDLDVMVAVIRIEDVINGQLDHDSAFFYFYVMTALSLGYGTEIIHGLAELSVAQRL